MFLFCSGDGGADSVQKEAPNQGILRGLILLDVMSVYFNINITKRDCKGKNTNDAPKIEGYRTPKCHYRRIYQDAIHGRTHKFSGDLMADLKAHQQTKG